MVALTVAAPAAITMATVATAAGPPTCGSEAINWRTALSWARVAAAGERPAPVSALVAGTAQAAQAESAERGAADSAVTHAVPSVEAEAAAAGRGPAGG